MFDSSLAACYTRIIEAGTELLAWYNTRSIPGIIAMSGTFRFQL
jgi:hypothetical protein